jgi:hypothetical protein
VHTIIELVDSIWKFKNKTKSALPYLSYSVDAYHDICIAFEQERKTNRELTPLK